MTDEKILESEELTDEQANEAAGGRDAGLARSAETKDAALRGGSGYTCNGCGRSFTGRPTMYNFKPYCNNCYEKTIRRASKLMER